MPKFTTQLTLLIMLPIVAVQVRYMVYFRSKRKARQDLAADLLEAVPHDLSIIGMTLGLVSVSQWITQAQSAGGRFVFLVAAILPMYAAAFIPLIEDRRFKLIAGIMAYLTGAASYFYS
jgi:hypothetical protein